MKIGIHSKKTLAACWLALGLGTAQATPVVYELQTQFAGVFDGTTYATATPITLKLTGDSGNYFTQTDNNLGVAYDLELSYSIGSIIDKVIAGYYVFGTESSGPDTSAMVLAQQWAAGNFENGDPWFYGVGPSVSPEALASGALTFGPPSAAMWLPNHDTYFTANLGSNSAWIPYDVKVSYTSATPVPEPSTYGLLGAGVLALLKARQRRQRQAVPGGSAPAPLAA